MRHTERHVSHDVSPRRRFLSRHPLLRKRIRRRFSGLSDVFSSGVELSIDVGRDPHILRSKRSTTSDDRIVLRKKRREIFAHNLARRISSRTTASSAETDLESDGLFRGVMELVLVHDGPHSTLLRIVKSSSRIGRGKNRLLRDKSISSPVSVATRRSFETNDIRFDDRIRSSINHRIDSKAEEICDIQIESVMGGEVRRGEGGRERARYERTNVDGDELGFGERPRFQILQQTLLARACTS